MTMPRLAKLFIFLLGIVIAGCSFGHEEYSASKDYHLPDGAPLVLEVNDFGRFWNRAKAEEALNQIAQATTNTNTVVLVFVHGWRHNAKADDGNLEDFIKTVNEMKSTLSSDGYIKDRQELGLKNDIKVISLYVGWRGKSLPSKLDLLTFWGRKSAAETVGDGDLREFLWKLQKLYMERNKAKETFMGLVTIGHSFGGQVVFKAVTETFEKDLTDVIAATKGERNLEGKLRANSIASGFGDMTVLINPALEAYQYERIHRLTQQLAFTPSQAPVLLVVSANNDWPRQNLFPWGRRLTKPFRPWFPDDDDQEQLWYTALGEYAPQQTHTLKQIQASEDSDYEGCKADFTGEITLGHAVLQPKKDIPRQPFAPVVVAYTASEIIDGHNEIFQGDFITFLTKYIAYVEGKRICLIRNAPPDPSCGLNH